MEFATADGHELPEIDFFCPSLGTHVPWESLFFLGSGFASSAFTHSKPVSPSGSFYYVDSGAGLDASALSLVVLTRISPVGGLSGSIIQILRFLDWHFPYILRSLMWLLWSVRCFMILMDNGLMGRSGI
jgi:hypothetical protein